MDYKIPLPQFTSELSQLLIPVSVGNLEVTLDLQFPFDKCIKNTNNSFLYHNKNTWSIKSCLTLADLEASLHAFLTSRFDYTNS